MKIAKFQPGDDKTCNVYIIGEEGKPCIVVDPGSNDKDFIDRYVDKHHAGEILGILLTHGHYDHIRGLVTLKHKCTVFLHEDEAEHLVEPAYNGSGWHEEMDDIVLDNINTYLLSDEDEITLGEYTFKIIHTPFHTRGSSCYYVESEKVLFSGDTLFHLAVGRTDLPTGSSRSMMASLSKLAALPGDVKVYPGHAESTTIANELAFNPYLSEVKCR
ncbi:MAG: MBL fold metallo-hydrolase [Bacilli bacterium]|nr:MBL fold metallo-hydrolase [Bacilli bacterium]